MAVGDLRLFPGFLTPVLTQLSFQSHRLFISHASEVRGKKKVRLNRVSNSQQPGHKSDTLTTELPGQGGDLLNEILNPMVNQSVESAGVIFIKGSKVRN